MGFLDWATSGLKTEPTTGQKASGWLVSQKPPAQYLNFWMNAVYQIFTGTVTAKALAVDATGDTAVTQQAGTISAGLSAGGASAPTPTPFVRGNIYKESAPFALCSSDGTSFTAGMNIASFTRTGTGQYTIVLSTHASAAGKLVCAAAGNGIVEALATDDHTITVFVYQFSTTPTIAHADNAWTLVVYHA